MITAEVNGKSYDGFTRISVTRNFSTLANVFSLEASDIPGPSFPIKRGDRCVVKVDGESVINGYIEIMRFNVSAKSHTLTFQGRDITGDIIDSTLSGGEEFSGNLTLADLCQKIVDELKLTDSVKVINSTETEQLDIASAGTGENAFSFLSKYANQRQVILNTDGDGNIVITRPTADTIKTKLVMNVGDESNNILSCSGGFNDTQRYNLYFMNSQVNPAFAFDKSGSIETKDVVNRFGKTEDNEIRPSRQYFLVGENPNDNDVIAKRTEWEANFRRSQSFDYTCVVQGHSYEDGAIWKPNLKVSIDDSINDVKGIFFLDEVRYSLSVSEGSLTSLKFLTQDAYQLQAEENARSKQSTTAASKYSFSELFTELDNG